MAAILRFFRLSNAVRTSGVSCHAGGLFLADTPLLRKGADGWTPRPTAELGALMLAGYGDAGGAARLSRGLQSAAQALNRGDVETAMVAALHLRLPEVSEDGATRLAKVEAFLGKYDPDEPRDWHGRWTTGGAGAGSAPAGEPHGSRPAFGGSHRRQPSRDRWPDNSDEDGAASDSDKEGDWSQPSYPSGGRLIPTGGAEADDYGVNEPPPSEGTAEPPPEPSLPSFKVPPGFDRNEGGAIVRDPRLPGGRKWPEADPDHIRELLKPDPIRPHPIITILVPWDAKGPNLLGADETGSFPTPPGYDRIEFIGTPQETFASKVRTRHADDGVEEALRMAETHQFSRFWFKRSFSTVTNGRIPYLIRPDFIGEYKPEIESGYRLKPYESYSPGQRPADRALQMPPDAEVAPLEGRFYKYLRLLLEDQLRKLRRLFG